MAKRHAENEGITFDETLFSSPKQLAFKCNQQIYTSKLGDTLLQATHDY